MDEEVSTVDGRSISREEWTALLDQDDDRTVDFWKQLMGEGKEAFHSSITEIKKIRDRSLEFMKMALLLGSFYIALLQYNGEENIANLTEYLVYLPFLPLVVSLFIFVFTYITPGSHTLGPSSGNAYMAISNDYDELEYSKVMAVIFFRWSDENFEKVEKSHFLQAVGIGCMFSSLGAMGGLMIAI